MSGLFHFGPEKPQRGPGSTLNDQQQRGSLERVLVLYSIFEKTWKSNHLHWDIATKWAISPLFFSFKILSRPRSGLEFTTSRMVTWCPTGQWLRWLIISLWFLSDSSSRMRHVYSYNHNESGDKRLVVLLSLFYSEKQKRKHKQFPPCFVRKSKSKGTHTEWTRESESWPSSNGWQKKRRLNQGGHTSHRPAPMLWSLPYARAPPYNPVRYQGTMDYCFGLFRPH